MGLEFDDTNGINQGTDFTGQGQAASDPGPAPASEGSNQSDGWATGQSQDIGDMFHRFSPQQQLMASKIGLFGNRNLPTDASGRTSYNAFTDSYGSAGDNTSSGNKGYQSQEHIPALPEGVDIAKNIEEAQKNGGLYWLYSKVKNKGPWDFKQQDSQYENGGNFHYGAVAEAAGVPNWFIMRAPGVAQTIAGTSSPEYGKPWGSPPYGDDPKDQYWIQMGRDYYNKYHRDSGNNTGWRKLMEQRLGRMN